MTATIPGAYISTTGFPGTFSVTSVGYVAGMLIEDPVGRYFLKGGILASSETLPMWGGVAVNAATIPQSGAGVTAAIAEEGYLLTRATVIGTGTGGLTGFSVFNQAYGMAIAAGSPVPLSASQMGVHWVALGSGARICLPVASNLTALEGGSIAQPISWDFSGQQITDYAAAYATANVSSATYTSSTGIISMTFSPAPFGAGVGSTMNGVYIAISGLAGTGVSVLNGDWPITSTGTSGTVINVQGPIGLGMLTITGSTGVLAAGGGALPAKLLEIVPTNCMTVSYNSTTGYATWNYNGAVAVVELSSYSV
jgi:hypothetical protein